jgi:hypothetical protein
MTVVFTYNSDYQPLMSMLELFIVKDDSGRA